MSDAQKEWDRAFEEQCSAQCQLEDAEDAIEAARSKLADAIRAHKAAEERCSKACAVFQTVHASLRASLLEKPIAS